MLAHSQTPGFEHLVVVPPEVGEYACINAYGGTAQGKVTMKRNGKVTILIGSISGTTVTGTPIPSMYLPDTAKRIMADRRQRRQQRTSRFM